MKKQKNKNSKVRTALHVLLAGVAAATVTTPIVLSNMDQSSVEVIQKKETEASNPFADEIGYYSKLPKYMGEDEIIPWEYQVSSTSKEWFSYIKGSQTHEYYDALFQAYFEKVKVDHPEIVSMTLFSNGLNTKDYSKIEPCSKLYFYDETGYNAVHKINLIIKGLSAAGDTLSDSYTKTANIYKDPSSVDIYTMISLDVFEKGNIDFKDVYTILSASANSAGTRNNISTFTNSAYDLVTSTYFGKSTNLIADINLYDNGKDYINALLGLVNPFMSLTGTFKEQLSYFCLSNLDVTDYTTRDYNYGFTITGFENQAATTKSTLLTVTADAESNASFFDTLKALVEERSSWSANKELYISDFNAIIPTATSGVETVSFFQDETLIQSVEEETSLLEDAYYITDTNGNQRHCLQLPHGTASSLYKYNTYQSIIDGLKLDSNYTYEFAYYDELNNRYFDPITEDKSSQLDNASNYVLTLKVYDTDNNLIDELFINRLLGDFSLDSANSGIDTTTGEVIPYKPTINEILSYDLNHNGKIDITEYFFMKKLNSNTSSLTAHVYEDADGDLLFLANPISVDVLSQTALYAWGYDRSQTIEQVINEYFNINYSSVNYSFTDLLTIDDYTNQTSTYLNFLNSITSNRLFTASIKLDSYGDTTSENITMSYTMANLIQTINRYNNGSNFQLVLNDSKGATYYINLELAATPITIDDYKTTFEYSSKEFDLEEFIATLKGQIASQDTHGDLVTVTVPLLEDMVGTSDADVFLKKYTSVGIPVYVNVTSTSVTHSMPSVTLNIVDEDPIIYYDRTTYNCETFNLPTSTDELQAIFNVRGYSSNGKREITEASFTLPSDYSKKPGSYVITATIYDELSFLSKSVELTVTVLEEPEIPYDSIIQTEIPKVSIPRYSNWENAIVYLNTWSNSLNLLDSRGEVMSFSFSNPYNAPFEEGNQTLRLKVTFASGHVVENSYSVSLYYPAPTINSGRTLLELDIENIPSDEDLISMYDLTAISGDGTRVLPIQLSYEVDFRNPVNAGTYALLATAVDEEQNETSTIELTLVIKEAETPTVNYLTEVTNLYKVGTTLEDIVSKSVVFRDGYLEEDNKLTSAGSYDEIDITTPGEYELTVTYTNKYDKSVSATFKFEIVNRTVEEFVNLESNYNINLSDVINGVNISDYLKDVKFLGIHDEELEFEVISQAFDNLLDLVELIKEHYETGAHTGGLSNYDFEKPMNAVVSAPGISQEFTITIIPDTKPFVHGGELNLSYVTINQSKISLVDFLKQFTIMVEDWIDGGINSYKITETDYKPGVAGEYTFTLEFTNSVGLSFSCVNKIKVIDVTAPVNTDGIKPIYYTYKKQDVYAILNGIYMVDDTDGVITDFVVSWDNYSPATEYGTYQVEVTFTNKAGLKTFATTTICYQKKVSFWQKIKNWFKKVDNSSFGQFWRHPIAKIKSWF